MEGKIRGRYRREEGEMMPEFVVNERGEIVRVILDIEEYRRMLRETGPARDALRERDPELEEFAAGFSERFREDLRSLAER